MLALVRASAIEYTASEASLSEDFIMISRRQAFAVTILGLIGGSTVALAQTKKGSAPVSQFDTDNDGTVDIDEAKKAASDLFDKLDTDKEGTLSIKELHGRLSSRDFSGADPDKDKTLTKDEYLTVVEKRFKAADTDNDGTVSAEEFRTAAGRALARLLH
jgi:Ca2+-binding EF-hand superfamily protein